METPDPIEPYVCGTSIGLFSMIYEFMSLVFLVLPGNDLGSR